jgi:hypothetical protein
MVSVMLNNGQGRFQDGRFVPVTGGAGLPVAADFNGDGKPDLAVTATGQGIIILLGTGNSKSLFTTGATIPITNTVFSVVTGDLNGDGIPDLLAAVAASSGSVINAYLGNCDGTFRQKSSTAVPNDGLLVLADFNQDGNLDFATSTGLRALGNGDGTFQTPVQIVDGSKFNWNAAGDLNGDGWPDLVFTEATSNSIYILINDQHGGFTQNVISTAAYDQGPYIVVLGDLNGDGILDAAVVFNWTSPGTISVLLGNGDGTFQPPVAYPVGHQPQSLVASHFDGRATLDLAVANSDATVTLMLGNGDGTFRTSESLSLPVGPYSTGPIQITAGDLNGDSNTDVVVSLPSYATLDASVVILLGDGKGGFQAPISYTLPAGCNATATAIGDFNSDGIPDLAVAGYPVAILLGNGDGTFSSARCPAGNVVRDLCRHSRL